jgi:long-chain acyl-CoA synthetase
VAYTRIFDIIRHQLETAPLEDCLARREDKAHWTIYSTAQFIDTANRVSLGLLELGLKKGDKVAIISTTNRPEWQFVDLACQQVGVIDVPIYPTISSAEYEYIFNHAEVRYIFISDKYLYRKIQPVLANITSLRGVYTFDDVEGLPAWKELLKDGDTAFLSGIRDSISEKDTATIIYTSGTTGTPKGVLLSHENIVSNVKGCLELVRVQPGERTLSFLPLCHVFERTINYVYFAASASVYYADGLESISENLCDIRPQFFATVPRLLERVYEKIIKKGNQLAGIKKTLFFWAVEQAEHIELGRTRSIGDGAKLALADNLIFAKWRDALGGRVKAIICGSAPLQPKLATIFTNAGIPILEGYGLTECAPVVSVVPYDKKYYRAGCVGKVLPNLQVKIASDGEILIKGSSVMQGYYKNEEETKKVFTEEGWLQSGDIGEFTSDGFLKITDRKKELFKTSGGKYVAPSPIENKLKESFFVEQVALVGDGQKFVSALIVPNFDELKSWAKEHQVQNGSNEMLISQPEVNQLYKDIISNFNVTFGKVEQVKQFRLITDEWTTENGLLTATLKLKRKKINENYQALIQSIYK